MYKMEGFYKQKIGRNKKKEQSTSFFEGQKGSVQADYVTSAD